MAVEICPCGLPLHYLRPESKAYMERMVELVGQYVTVTTPDGSWRVPRHWIALHGLKATELPLLAWRYGFEAVAQEG